MTIVLESTSTVTTNGARIGDPMVCNKPAGTVSGDVLVAAVAFSDAGTDVLCSGWTKVNSRTSYWHLYVLYKVAGGSEPSTYGFEPQNVNWVEGRGVILRFSGVDNATPSDATSTNNAGNDTTPRGLSITTATNNAMLVMSMWTGVNGGAAITPPTGWNEAVEMNNMEACNVIQATAGASGNKDATQSASNLWETILWALKPSGGAAAGIMPKPIMINQAVIQSNVW